MPYGGPFRPPVAPECDSPEQAVRLVAIVTTGGLSNPLISMLEDGMSLLLPLLAVVLLTALIFVGYQL
ncbi:hypothetical protein GCM10008949_36480 [Deinococcus humi]|nr:hypothetical protein GCM10008949_36480 [Deinococcus humi]